MSSNHWYLGISFLVGLGVSLVVSPAPGQEESSFHMAVDGEFRYGSVSGFAQIPKGGGVGSTSHQRPRFAELGIDHAAIGDPSITLGWNDHDLYAGARIVRLSGSSRLSTDLISHGTTFPAGTSVNADIQLDWYRIGYEYRVSYKDDHRSILSLYPAVGLALFNFDYLLKGTGGLSAGRSFAKGAPQVGLRSEWTPEGPFSVSGELLSSLPFSTIPLLFSTDLTAGYQLWGRPDRGGIAYVGIGYDRIDEEDHQTVPNHIQASIGPELIVGLKARFR